MIVKGDERTILIEDGVPTAWWTPQPADQQLFAEADYVLAGGTLDDDILSWILHVARENEKPVAINPTRVQRLTDLNLEGVVLVQVSRPDLPNFGFDHDAPARKVAGKFLDLGAKAVSITDDANPEWVFTSGGYGFKIPSIPGRRPLYPTGCGDASFLARVAGIIRFGLDHPEKSFNVGSLAGGFYIEHGRPGTWAELENLSREYPLDRR